MALDSRHRIQDDLTTRGQAAGYARHSGGAIDTRSLPRPVRGLANKVVQGTLTPADLERMKGLPEDAYEFEFVRVLAGGNPKFMPGLIGLARHSLERDLQPVVAHT